MRYIFASLKFRLLAIVTLALIPALMLILYSGFEQREKAVKTAVTYSGRLVQRVASEQEKVFHDTAKVLSILSLFPEIDPAKAEACNGLLKQAFSNFSEIYVSFAAFTPRGDVFCSAPPTKNKINIADRPHYKAALATGKVAFGQYSISRLTNKGKPAVYVAQPVMAPDGSLRALINVGMSLDYMGKLLEDLITTRFPPGASATIFDAKGTVLVSYPPRPGLVGKPLPEKTISEAAFKSSKFASTRLNDRAGREILYGYAPLSVNNSRAYVAVSIPMAAVVSEANKALTRNLALLGVAALVALVVTWLATGAFALSHIDVLVDAAKRLGEGEMDARVTLSGGADELNTLATTFNVMAQRLRATMDEREQVMADLRDLNHDLEDKVRARTAEIERREAEVRAVLDNVAEGVIVTTEDGVIESANPTASEMFANQRALAGQSFFGLFAAEHQGAIRAALDASAETVKEYTARHPDGSVFSVELIVSNMEAAGVRRRVAVVRDISERKEAEAQLAEIQKKLVDAAHQSGMAEIATGVLHNIGNVLNSVCLGAEELDRLARESKIANLIKANALMKDNGHRLAEFLAEDPKGRKLGEYLDQVTVVLTQENDLVRTEIAGMLEKTRMMRDVIVTQQEYARARHMVDDVNLSQLIEDALKVEQSGIHSAGVNLVRNMPSLPLCRVHKTKLLQVVTNLVKNAREATEDNDKLNREKLVSLETGLYDTHHAYLKVTDNGSGIADENLTRIFQHGFTTKANGHGFGLHASANAMREMGGELRAESPGEQAGASFTLIIPLADNPHE